MDNIKMICEHIKECYPLDPECDHRGVHNKINDCDHVCGNDKSSKCVGFMNNYLLTDKELIKETMCMPPDWRVQRATKAQHKKSISLRDKQWIGKIEKLFREVGFIAMNKWEVIKKGMESE